MKINTVLVKRLIEEQFPQWANLPIEQVIPGGHDNRTFRLGNEMSIRLPSAECYAAKVKIEQEWLPILATQLSIQIPQPIAMGKPSNYYPWHWSIYKWLAGESANNIKAINLDLSSLAKQLASFLKELHTVDTTGAPIASPHNFYRGGDLFVYDGETQQALKNLEGHINTSVISKIWQRALSSQWLRPPVWIHGDLSSGNILIKDQQLVAVIDFGGMAIGDPSCDLCISWLFFDNESRDVFKSNLNLDIHTWERARGWAMWKALITLEALENKNGLEAIQQQQIINILIKEYESC